MSPQLGDAIALNPYTCKSKQGKTYIKQKAFWVWVMKIF